MPRIYVAIVDDDESVCRSFGRLLSAAGFQPVTYPSAASFLADTKHPSLVSCARYSVGCHDWDRTGAAARC
jgi:FixJ family two-component response regulator